MVVLGGYFLLGESLLLEVDSLVDFDHGTCAFLGLHVQDVSRDHILLSFGTLCYAFHEDVVAPSSSDRFCLLSVVGVPAYDQVLTSTIFSVLPHSTTVNVLFFYQSRGIFFGDSQPSIDHVRDVLSKFFLNDECKHWSFILSISQLKIALNF